MKKQKFILSRLFSQQNFSSEKAAKWLHEKELTINPRTGTLLYGMLK